MNSDSNSCKSMCWVIAAVAGAILALILIMASGMGWFWALIIGLVVFGILGFVLPGIICSDAGAETPVSAAPPPATRVEPEPAPAPAPEPEPAEEAVAAEPEPEPEPTPEPPIAAAPEPEPVVEAEGPEPAEDEAPAEEPAPDIADQAEEDAEAEPAPPVGISEAREGGADDLKRIKGVGPKLEQLLHSHGIFHFDQIAAWGPSDVAWMDENLAGFRGRVTRDDWVGQAGLLAAGGETDFSRKVGEGDVY